jgi:hypothetical protein
MFCLIRFTSTDNKSGMIFTIRTRLCDFYSAVITYFFYMYHLGWLKLRNIYHLCHFVSTGYQKT